jgi:hypothetical protein
MSVFYVRAWTGLSLHHVNMPLAMSHAMFRPDMWGVSHASWSAALLQGRVMESTQQLETATTRCSSLQDEVAALGEAKAALESSLAAAEQAAAANAAHAQVQLLL